MCWLLISLSNMQSAHSCRVLLFWKNCTDVELKKKNTIGERYNLPYVLMHVWTLSNVLPLVPLSPSNVTHWLHVCIFRRWHHLSNKRLKNNSNTGTIRLFCTCVTSFLYNTLFTFTFPPEALLVLIQSDKPAPGSTVNASFLIMCLCVMQRTWPPFKWLEY